MVAFVEKLTNWYIRRSRRRFWKSEDDDDKASAYATLYRVLVTFVKSLAPVLPFATEKIYQNLVRSWDPEAPLSVHLCDMPEADEEMRDSGLEQQMALAARAVTLGRSLRSRHEIRIRQPLGRVLLLPPDESGAEKLADLADLVADELNVKKVVFVEDETEISEVSCKANYRALGPRFGKRVKEVAAFIEKLTRAEVARLEAGERMPVAGGTIGSDDVQLTRSEKEGVAVAVDGNLCVGLDVNLDKELIREGTAREVVNRVQNLRKTAGLEVSDRIRLWIAGSRPVVSASRHHRNYIAAETLATEIRLDELPGEALLRKESDIDGETVTFAIDRA
jgi:isoleucyl-tRNA synthetase